MSEIERWALVAGRWGASSRAVDDAVRESRARYAEAHRRYHTAEHIDEVFAALDALGGAAPAVEAAAWLHDVVYDPTGAAGESGEASARYAADLVLRLGGPAATAAETARLVRSTESHSPSDPAAALLSDADLWILGAPP